MFELRVFTIFLVQKELGTVAEKKRLRRYVEKSLKLQKMEQLKFGDRELKQEVSYISMNVLREFAD